MRRYMCGAIPSPSDSRDYKITRLFSVTENLPEEYVNPLVKDIEVQNQGQTSKCVAYSLAYLRWLTEYEQSNNRKLFSADYIYGNRTGDMYLGEGMIDREALRTLTMYGTCHAYDFKGERLTYEECAAAYSSRATELDEKAKPFRVSLYYRVSGAAEIKNTVMKLGGVSVMFPVFPCMYEPEGGKILYSATETNTILDYHQLTVVGWRADGWIALNSWGKEWGVNGFGIMPYNYPVEEAWAIVDNVKEMYYAPEFSDLKENHWAAESIKKAVRKGAFRGFEDGTFRPDAPLTRAQACVVLDKLGLLEE